jgi:hypothetical protein
MWKKGECGNPRGKKITLSQEIGLKSVKNPMGRPKKGERIDTIALLKKRNYCPITHAIDLIQSQQTSTKEKIDLIKMLAAKVSPDLKAVEHKTDDTQHDAMLESIKTVMQGLSDQFKRDY